MTNDQKPKADEAKSPVVVQVEVQKSWGVAAAEKREAQLAERAKKSIGSPALLAAALQIR